MKLQHIDHVAITLSDLERSRTWDGEVLGLERRHEEEWGDVPTMMCAGETCVALFPSDVAEPKGADARNTVSMRHFAFRVDRPNLEAAQAQFRELGIEFESAEGQQIAHLGSLGNYARVFRAVFFRPHLQRVRGRDLDGERTADSEFLPRPAKVGSSSLSTLIPAVPSSPGPLQAACLMGSPTSPQIRPYPRTCSS
jgi:catechol 2,3-dioxygenase-like lactoylglutathione lyase family enzyme